MSDATTIPFRKMNGLGNEIVVVDLRGSAKVFTAAEAAAIAARSNSHFDQMMVLHDPRLDATDAFVRIYNSDGSTAGACGNGMRCVALTVSHGSGKPAATYETAGGILNTKVISEQNISVSMGRPKFGWEDIPLKEEFHDTTRIELQIGPIDEPVLHSPSVANIGNPHAIFWVRDVNAHALERFGPILENHPIFPDRANISLAEVTTRSALTLRTWERGTGITRACGSAACAAAVCAARKGMTGREVTVTVPGGPLHIDWRADDVIVMTGPAELEYDGVLDLAGLDAAAD